MPIRLITTLNKIRSISNSAKWILDILRICDANITSENYQNLILRRWGHINTVKTIVEENEARIETYRTRSCTSTFYVINKHNIIILPKLKYTIDVC
jgi:hypothetical protein